MEPSPKTEVRVERFPNTSTVISYERKTRGDIPSEALVTEDESELDIIEYRCRVGGRSDILASLRNEMLAT